MKKSNHQHTNHHPRVNSNSEALMNHSTSVISENSSPEEVEQAVDQIHADYQKFRAELG